MRSRSFSRNGFNATSDVIDERTCPVTDVSVLSWWCGQRSGLGGVCQKLDPDFHDAKPDFHGDPSSFSTLQPFMH
jgi:hypothetical protein